MRKVQLGASVLELVEGDITQQDTEAIVNAANTSLLGGGGVDGAIHRAGGPQILEECRKIGGCPTGEARITTGGRLRARWVIHTVGPVYRDGKHGEAELLASAYRNSLRLASEQGIQSLAFPSISTGAYGYPMADAARIALRTAIEYLKDHPEVTRVRFVLFGSAALRAYETVLDELLPPEGRRPA
ncbi:MAG: O-acetyl-ADP-ribose deacetylase [candidate division NC10 bacterium]|nr:O-acetyl-ADP-ribose deacetylase [candidate division NC10 bacterium]MBI2455632.1 O-acetyl-ADP-ribose deacetylase [candidate division NC10 bacterium]MBI3121304.1 O-acetyl-ADP-ribose deacetylase [candidate division NC10 bacterium]